MAKLDEIITGKGIEEQKSKIRSNLRELNVQESGVGSKKGKERYSVYIQPDPGLKRRLYLNHDEVIDAGIGFGNLSRSMRKESYDPISKYNLALAGKHTPEMSVDEACSLVFEDKLVSMVEEFADHKLFSKIAEKGRLAEFIADYAKDEVRNEISAANSFYSDARRLEKGDPSYRKQAKELRKQRVALNKEIKIYRSLKQESRPSNYQDMVKQSKDLSKQISCLKDKIDTSIADYTEQVQELDGKRLGHLKKALAYATIADQREKVETLFYNAMKANSQNVVVALQTPQSETTNPLLPLEETAQPVRTVGKHTLYSM